MYRASGRVARYLKVAKLSVYKALGGSRALPVRPHYPVHHAPSAKMVPVSLARNGLPRFILRRHRNMVSQGKEVDRWVRIYVTLFDLHKLI